MVGLMMSAVLLWLETATRAGPLGLMIYVSVRVVGSSELLLVSRLLFPSFARKVRRRCFFLG
jgi:hypothetical protein